MTWELFQRQFEAQGREKADGYAPGMFEGLSDAERAQARAMMLDRALAGDTIDLNGLRHVGDAATAAALAAVPDAGRRFGWCYAVARQETLFALTGDGLHLTNLAPWLDGRDKEAQKTAAYALSRFVPPAALEGFVTERICGRRHEAALIPLLKAWIAIRQRAPCGNACFDRNLDWIRRVMQTRPKARAALLRAWAPQG